MSGFKHKRLVLSVASALAISCSAISSAAYADAVAMKIPAQSASTAMIELGKRTNVEIIFKQGVNSSVQLPSLDGEYSLEGALNTMLNGSGLTYQVTGEGIVLISEETDNAEGGDEEPDEEVVITGTRLKGVSTAGAQVVQITREDFERRGFTSMEDVLRSLPQNHGSGFANVEAAGGAGRSGVTNPLRESGSLGGDFANLRGLGEGRTLVLVNGRRTAASQVLTTNTGVDLGGIPFNSIERVEIMLDGGSAVYGSDAQGGVINIITRKDYSGLEISARYQDESTGGGQKRLQFSFGHNWDGGSLLIGGTTEEVDPIIAAETLYGGTQDFRPFGGIDARSRSNLRNPIISDFFFNSFIAAPGVAIDTPFTDLATDSRFLSIASPFVNPDDPANVANRFDNPDAFFGIESETDNVFVTIQQDLSDSVRAQLDVRYSESDRVQDLGIPFAFSLFVPTSNAFNETGSPLFVDYTFVSELERGLVERDITTSYSKTLTYDLSAEWDITDDWLLRGGYTHSEDESASNGLRFVNTNLQVSPLFQSLLDDSNIDTAFNPFGDGSTNTMDLRDVRFPFLPVSPNTGEAESFELSLQNSNLFELPGGSVSALVGVEQRTQTRDDRLTFAVDPDNGQILDEVARTREGGERDVFAYYVEFNVPVIGEGNSLPGVQSLTLSIQGRVDDYDYSPDAAVFADPGAVAAAVAEDPFLFFTPEVFDRSTRRFEFDSGFVPRVGIDWQVTDDFKVRMSYSEAFRAPELGIAIQEPLVVPFAFDPRTTLDPANPDLPPTFYSTIVQGNLNLGPETGETRTLGFDWTPSFLDGFQLSMTLNDIHTENVFGNTGQFLTVGELFDFYPGNEAFVEQFIARDLDTELITALQFAPVNIGSLRNRALDFDASYAFDNDAGSFLVGVTGTYTGRNTQGLPLGELATVGQAFRNRDGTEFGPDTWVGNAFVNYSRDQLDLNMFVNYSSAYINSLGPFANFDDPDNIERVEGYWTIDLTGGYNFTDYGVRVNAGIRNLTDNDAPRVNFTSPVTGENLLDPARVDLRGRMAYLEVTKSFEF